SAVLEPPANARYRVPVAALSFDSGSTQTQAIGITNSGTKAWTATGAGSVRLIWEIRDAVKKVVATSPAPIPLPALAPAATATVNVTFGAPEAIGDYTMTIGLADATGNALAAAGAATGSFGFHVHVPFLVASVARIPQIVHRSEASLLIVQYSSLPAAGADSHAYTLFWRAIDPATNKALASGSSPLGSSLPTG